MRTNITLLAMVIAMVAMAAGVALPGLVLAAPPAVLEQEPIYALPWTLERATDQESLTYFLTENGSRYAIFGATPEVEADITRLLDQDSGVTVKVWGNLFPQGRQYSGPEIIATAVQEAAATATPTPTASPTPTPQKESPVAVGHFEYVNLRVSPDAASTVVGQIVAGERCDIIGRSANNSYLQVRCESTEGWVSSTTVKLEGDLSQVPVPDEGRQVSQIPAVMVGAYTPMPPTPSASWQAVYYANRDLQGNPILVQETPRIDYNWGSGSPHPAVPIDNFSARYERVIDFASGQYRLCVCNLDDGARMWIDDELVLNDWREAPARDLIVDRNLSGPRRLRIEYFEGVNLASIGFNYTSTSSRANEWQASYWNNTTMEGPAVLTRSESRPSSAYALDYVWGTGSPAPGVVNADLFSAKWEGAFSFDAGSYVFEAVVDDGVRVYIDGTLVLYGWRDGYEELRSGVYSIGQGQHQIRVEYYERTGDATVRVRWYVEQGVIEY